MSDQVSHLILLAARTLPWVFLSCFLGWCVLVFAPGLAFRAGRYDLAGRAAEWSIRLTDHPTVLASAMFVRGDVRSLRGDLESAVGDYEMAITSHAPAATGASLGLVAALIELRRDPVRAWALLDEVSSVRPVAGEDLLRAHLLLLAGRVDEADAAFARWRATPREGLRVAIPALFEAWTLSWEGWYLLRRGRAVEARPLLERAVAADAAHVYTLRAKSLLNEISTGERMRARDAA